MDDILLVKGAAMEASPSFTITDCSSTSLSISFRIFCSFARVFTGVPPSALGLFLGPLFMGDKVSFLESSRLSESILSGGLDRIATPTSKKKKENQVYSTFITSSSSTYPLERVSMRRHHSSRHRTSMSYSLEIVVIR